MSADETKVWVVQIDVYEKDDQISARRVFRSKSDAIAFARDRATHLEKCMIIISDERDDGEVHKERCPYCTDSTKCHACNWCRSRNYEDGHLCCMNEEQVLQSTQTYFYFKTKSPYSDYYDKSYYKAEIMLEHLIIE